MAVAGLEDGDVTGQIPKSPTFLSQLLDLSEYVAKGGCPKD